jgi:chitin-binding protein
LAALSATALLATGIAVAIAPTGAQAHGVAMFPAARTFMCYQDGLTPQGNIVPNNPACAAAVAANGTTPLYNWFAVLRSDAGGRTTGFIPDGQICSGGTGGPFDFTGYNAARNDWPLTHLTSGASYQFHYSNWAAHPGAFNLYITRDGWSPTTPLAWADLVPFGSVTNPPASGGPGAMNYYFWNQQLPAKTGRHIIYIQWVRSDSQENFFSCSDVVFDGGNGNVTGVGPGGSGPPPPGQLGLCTATYRTTNSWPGGFQGEVTVSAGTTAVSGWTTSFTPGSGSTIIQVWNGVYLQSGTLAVVRNASWDRQVPASTSITYGMVGSGTAPAAPTVTCTSP